MWPTFDDIEYLHKKYAPSVEVFNLVFTHCQIVADIARDLLKTTPQSKINDELVQVGCLLHDIGVYSLDWANGRVDHDRYITHGIKGYDILKFEGYREEICRMASHHTGVGLRKQEIISRDLPLPHIDFLAETIEERLVMYADKFHSKSPQFNSFESYRKRVSQFGPEKVIEFEKLAHEFGLPDLDMLSSQYHQITA